MADRKESMIRQFVINRAWPELCMLGIIGGRPLRSLTTNIFTGFGLYPGRDKELATHLSTLPMAIVDSIPTFIYTHNGITKPLLISASRFSTDTIHQTMFVIEEGTYHQYGIRKTPTLTWVVRGAERLHRAMGISQSRDALYTHIVSANKQAAVAKGITI